MQRIDRPLMPLGSSKWRQHAAPAGCPRSAREKGGRARGAKICMRVESIAKVMCRREKLLNIGRLVGIWRRTIGVSSREIIKRDMCGSSGGLASLSGALPYLRVDMTFL